jgi:phage/plasmid-like protein (TIGR03299 family)
LWLHPPLEPLLFTLHSIISITMAPAEFTSGVFAFNQPAWHNMGEVIANTLPAEEMFRRAGALFPVQQLQLWGGDPLDDAFIDQLIQASTPADGATNLGGLHAIQRRAAIRAAITNNLLSLGDSRIGIWRPDERKILGTASPGYQIIPNQRLLDFANALREEVDMDTVVVLRGGAKVAFTAKIRGTDTQVAPGDRIYRNIIGWLGHDGSTSFGGSYSDVRVSCSNTLGFAIAEGNRHGRTFSIKHNQNDIAQIDRILGSIDIARQSFAKVIDDYQAMRDTPMSIDLYRHWLEQVYQVPSIQLDNGDTRPGRISDLKRKWPQLENAWHDGLGREVGAPGTLYWGLNCVTQAETSQLTKGAGKRRLHSTLFGSGRSIVQRANDLARELITA